MAKVYLSGNTVRLQCTFYDFNDVEIDPTLVRIVLYDERYSKLDEISISDANKVNTGTYYYDYIVNKSYENQRMYYEWYGEIDGTPSLDRGTFIVKFI